MQIDWGVVLDTPQCFDSNIADPIDPIIDSPINETVEQQIDWSAVFNVEVNIQRQYSNKILLY